MQYRPKGGTLGRFCKTRRRPFDQSSFVCIPPSKFYLLFGWNAWN
jgi:hypothetical protein